MCNLSICHFVSNGNSTVNGYRAGNIYVVENLPAGHRLWMSTLVTWAPNFLVFALFAWLTKEWR